MSSKLKGLIVSCDPGGAEIVSSWVLANKESMLFDFLLAGPAKAIFETKLADQLPIEILDESEVELKEYDVVLCATGWSTDLEVRYLHLAKQAQIKCIAYLDHWSEYLDRFKYQDKLVIPDEIWVGDEYALKLAEESLACFGVPIRYKENEYFKALKQRAIANVERSDGVGKVLYLSEPILDDPREYTHYGLSEFKLLEAFLRQVSVAQFPVVVVLRLHPLESKEKYASLLEQFADGVTIELSSTSLIEDCLNADVIVGIASMAMMVAKLLGRKVTMLQEAKTSGISSLPCEFDAFCPSMLKA